MKMIPVELTEDLFYSLDSISFKSFVYRRRIPNEL